MNKLKILVFLVLLLSSTVLAQPRIEVEDEIWDLGNINKTDVIDKIIRIKNVGDSRLIIKKVRPSCDCITAGLLNVEADRDGYVQIKAVFNANEVTGGKFTKYIYIQSNDPKEPLARIIVKGVVSGESPGIKIDVVLFYAPGCRGCRYVKDIFLGKLIEKYRGEILIKSYDIDNTDNYLLLMQYEERYGVKENDPMIVFAGERYFSGKRDILNRLGPYLDELAQTGGQVSKELNRIDRRAILNRFKSFSPSIILLAGLIDGLNPCAFVTAVFLISFLYLLEKSRREILFIGILFSLGVFVAYLLIGLGLRGILYRMEIFNVISNVIYVLAISLVLILGCYSLYDAFTYLRSGDMRLKLPGRVVMGIHNIIKTGLGTGRLLPAVFLAGFIVSLLESICTGQVYLPAIILMMKEPAVRYSSILYLILYNLAFIIPLLAVMILSFFGVGLKGFISFSKKNTFIAKLLLSLVFFILGISLILAG